MSTYYSFYLGARDDAGKMCIVGPYYYNVKEGKTKLGVLYETSRSFISAEEFQEAMHCLPVDEIAEKDMSHLATENWFGDGHTSTSYYASINEFYALAKKNNHGLYVGYVTHSEMNAVAENKYWLESRYDVDLVSPDVVAEIDPEERKKYGKTAFVATTDTSYIADVVYDAAESVLNYVYGKDKDRYYILMSWG